MVENVWRKVVFIVLMLVVMAGIFFYKGVRLGLDLKGGARFVYRLDIDGYRKDIDPQASSRAIIEETISILYNRIDPNGSLDASIQPQGTDRILIEIPGRQESEIASVRKRIQQLGKLEWKLVVETTQKEFDIDAEKDVLTKWLNKPVNQALVGRDPMLIANFNRLPTDMGGPKRLGKIHWVPMDPKADPMHLEVTIPIKWTDSQGEAKTGNARYIPISLAEESFSGEDLSPGSIKQVPDEMSRPAISFELIPSRKADFREFTERNIKKPFAIMLNGYCRTAPTINAILPGAGIITGGQDGFGADEIRDLIITLRTGSLKIKPELESETTLGPTVGEQAIQTGTLSMILGGLAVIFFMLTFYRASGIVAVISLFVNMILIMGIMAMFRFTLTLPGLAGLVLTMGMAVDANILIFERIREELDKGKVLMQAIKNGFQMAMSTIVDANLTTLITALILHGVGTGPIKGFAITLAVGIMTSMFAALFVSKVIFHLLGDELKVLKALKMGRVFKNPKYPFMAIRKPFNLLSGALILFGILIFFITPAQTKLGIDFTGGFSIRLALNKAQDIQEVREKVLQKMPNAQVNTLGGLLGQIGDDETTTGNKGKFFAVKFKHLSGQQDKDAGAKYRNDLRDALGDWLVSNPISDFKSQNSADGNFSHVEFQMHTEKPVKVADLNKILGGVNNALTITPAHTADKDKEAYNDFAIYMRMDAGMRESDLGERLASMLTGIKDTTGNPITMSEPFPEVNSIGARVVGELKSLAIMAILLSLFAVVMYIRLRFHEYKYGIAAVVALVHDVIIALGAVVLCNRIGLVNAELDLPLVAAFLTIIGYSLNDTIVVFDRIRENLPRLPGTYEEILNLSINQTLARTIWTSATTFVVLFAIFLLNYGQKNVLEGFSFAMLIGVIVGTYSSIFVASPALIMLHSKEEQAKAMKPEDKTK